jgi:hypothetical protein
MGIHEHNVALRLTRKKQKLCDGFSGNSRLSSRQAPLSERLATPGNRYENTKRTGFAHVRGKGSSGRYYRAGNARQRAGIRASGRHRAVASSADAHGSRSHGASRLCVGWRPLALGWPRLRMGAGPLAAGTGRRTLGAGSLGTAGTELAMDRRSLGSLNPARLRSLSPGKARQTIMLKTLAAIAFAVAALSACVVYPARPAYYRPAVVVY